MKKHALWVSRLFDISAVVALALLHIENQRGNRDYQMISTYSAKPASSSTTAR